MSIIDRIFGNGNETDWNDPNARWDGTDEHWEHLQSLNHSTRYSHTGDGGNIGMQQRREEHAPRMSGKEARSVYRAVTKSTNRETTSHEKAVAEGARQLNRVCRTGARVTGGNAFHSKVEYHFDKDHGFGHGRSGRVEVVDNRTVVIHNA